MLALERLTTEYISIEDRIRLTGLIPDGRTITLWITQRMLGMLLPHLLTWLGRKYEQTSKSASRRDAAVTDMMQSFAQESAVSSLKSQEQEAVRATAQDQGLLVHSIDITTGDLGVRIIFKTTACPEEFEAIHLTMEDEALRQWLFILYMQARNGGWPLSAWPSWIQDQTAEESRQKISAH